MRGLWALVAHPLRSCYAVGVVATGPYRRSVHLRWRLHSLLTIIRSIAVIGVAAASKCSVVHADFADDPASAAWLTHRVLRVPFSFRDHFSYNPQIIGTKVRDAAVVLACCTANTDALMRETMGTGRNVVTSYLGVDTRHWTSVPPSQTRQVAAVGTLQTKKGQDDLIRACAILVQRRVEVRCILIGDGPTRRLLEELIARLGLRDTVTITGYVSNDLARRHVADAAALCLPSVVTDDGDHDGIPIALMEAMSMGKPCVSTTVAGIPELITDGEDGLLVSPRDPDALADSIERLLVDREFAAKLGAAARRKIESRFDLRRNAAIAAELLTAALGRTPSV